MCPVLSRPLFSSAKAKEVRRKRQETGLHGGERTGCGAPCGARGFPLLEAGESARNLGTCKGCLSRFQAVEGDWAAGRQGIAAGPLNSSTTDLGTYTLLPFLNEMMPSGVF